MEPAAPSDLEFGAGIFLNHRVNVDRVWLPYLVLKNQFELLSLVVGEQRFWFSSRLFSGMRSFACLAIAIKPQKSILFPMGYSTA